MKLIWLAFILIACSGPEPDGTNQIRAHGYDLGDSGDWQGALRCFEDAGDREDQANALAMLGRWDAEAVLRAELLAEDPLTAFNLGAALLEAGHAAEGWLWDAASRTPPEDPLLARTLFVLADLTDDPKPAAELRRAAEDYDHARP